MPSNALLIVDDEPQNLAAMRQILVDDYPLAFARNGAEALTAAARCAPALVLLDIQMPEMDGYQVCRTLKADPATASIPVIFVSGLTDVGHEAEGFAAGAVDYIAKPYSPPTVRARVATHLSLVQASRLERSYHDAIAMLGMAGHYNDTDTGLHIWRMGAYARELAGALGWPSASCNELEQAAPMHDTGKIGIPGEILRKPGKLDADEWEIMKGHARIGHEILSRSDAAVFKLAAEIALRHHERWDGSGYPDGLAGESIPESARIVAIADVFDALTMKRPYKDAWPIERTMTTLRESSGSHFDPRLLDRFVEILPRILEVKSQWDARESA
ncbi:HD domain-containing phosphohydrolase [Thiocystis violascens]|uniref:Response regulator containing a CheY-like receiver domain and an HD-GYP domain n=1 Tax=Thiocystis violascens (strain ATCC 17096 / DSM 198 / 6111) TaxID=765911 RepID=I3Y9M5_THIV6|nr:HD domain-containing phosphohydrolase [Thiocystis violascens]AFL73693.1 response regulator containing a CheY-like receiver domain and an HD-GYP domain [Thiocystis violascens DSM 198]